MAYCSSVHSAQLGDQMPTRSPFSSPAASRPAGERVDVAVELGPGPAPPGRELDQRLAVGGGRRRCARSWRRSSPRAVPASSRPGRRTPWRVNVAARLRRLEPMDTEAVLALLVDVAEEVINPRFRSLAAHEVDEKNPGDLVTVADHESERLITDALRAAYPDAVVLGEEAYAGDAALLTAFRDRRARLHRRPGRRHQELRARLPRPRGDGRRGALRRGGARVDLAAAAPDGVRRGARRRRVAQRGAAGAAAGRGAAARRHLAATVAGPDARGPAPDGADLGLLRRRLPEAGRGRGRRGALRPGQPVGPRARLAAAHRGRRVRRARTPATPYRPGDDLEIEARPAGLVAAADRATYERVVRLL